MNQDKLLNDWGIHHIHFKEEKTKELLFVFFNQKNAYLIDIMPHENPELEIITWANSNLIQILHNNWPDLLIPYKMNLVAECRITDKNRQALRNNNANAFITVLDGTTYMPLGGGLVSSGHGITDIIQKDKTIEVIKTMQEYLQKELAKENIASLQLESFEANENLKINNYYASARVVFPDGNQTGSIRVNVSDKVMSYSLIKFKDTTHIHG